MKFWPRASTIAAVLLFPAGLTQAAPIPVYRDANTKMLTIDLGGRPFATIVLDDPVTRRPYFKDVHAPNGMKVTRNHPPVPGKDAIDHATWHPGLWMSFGELSGADFWRSKGLVRSELLGQPEGDAKRMKFALKNRYFKDDTQLAEEHARFTLNVLPEGYLLEWDSEFVPTQAELVFGDQEEMGLGVRMATELTVKQGNGRILNSAGKRNEKEVWGKTADWCDYSGAKNGQTVGVLLMPDPRNLRPSWFHARDYGLLVANLFGRNAFTNGEKSRIVIPKGQTLRLRYGVLIHSEPEDKPVDFAKVYADYVARAQATASAIGSTIRCPGTYRGHLQGIAREGTEHLFWSFTDKLVKTDFAGKILKECDAPSHQGDLCFADGKLYVAVNLGPFNHREGKADSWVYVYDAANLGLLSKHRLPEAIYGAGGIAEHNGRFVVVGGLPPGHQENWAFEYDKEFRLIRKHSIASGYTLMGIQTATYVDGCWWFGCYGKPPVLLKTDDAFQLVGRYEFEAGLGIEALPDGRFLVGRGTGNRVAGYHGSVRVAVADLAKGLVLPSTP